MSFISNEFEQTDGALADLLRRTALDPLNNARLLENISVSSSSDTNINHGLDRVPKGYIVVKKLAACDVYHTSLSTLTMSIRSTVSTTISILVF